MDEAQWWPDRGPDLKGNKGVVGRFIKTVITDQAKSLHSGKEQVKDAIIVEIKALASKDVFAAELKPGNVERFKARLPEAWAAFESNYELIKDGTSLLDIPLMRPETAIMLSMAGINTAEELRDAPPEALKKLEGGMALQKAAAGLFASKQVEQAVPMKRRGRPPKEAVE
jgi:hypothetical protein